MSRWRPFALSGMLATAGIVAAVGARAQTAAGSSVIPVQVGIAVVPETVTVGEPFVVAIRVRAAKGATVAFPAGPDSGATVELLDPRAVQVRPDTTGVDATANYRLVAWDVDSQPVHLGDAVVQLGQERRPVSLGGIHVVVRRLLPADSARRVPKPARDIVADVVPWWTRWWWAIAVALLLALLAWLVGRRRGRRPSPTVDPLARAEGEFARVEALGLVEAGERGRFVALVVEIVREYLAARVEPATPALTSGELLDVVRDLRGFPAARLEPVLAEADLIKFARHPVSADRARALGREARAVVREADRALAPPAAEGAPSDPSARGAAA